MNSTNENNGIFPASAVANFFIDKSLRSRRRITNLRLQKLVYFAYGWCWPTYDRKLFAERVEAWKLGPVIPDLYHEFKHLGDGNIRSPSVYYDKERNDLFVVKITDTEMLGILHDKVWNKYTDPTYGLVNKTHQPGTPWYETYHNSNDSIIPDDLIKEHFKNLANMEAS